MKRISIFPFVVMGFILLTASCCKDDNEPRRGKSTAVFNPDKTYGTVKDIDGNVYRTITIGGQTWMAENLRVTRYQNGDPIPNVKGDTDIWLWGKQTEGAYCSYKNTKDLDSIATFGFLYNGFAVTDSRGLAPEGWHAPIDAEWITLIVYVDGGDGVTNEHAISTIAGGRLREAGTLHWGRANRGDNSSGFTALPGGIRDPYQGAFTFIGYFGGYWTASKSTHLTQYFWNTDPDFLSIGRAQASFTVGMSVRCIKD